MVELYLSSLLNGNCNFVEQGRSRAHCDPYFVPQESPVEAEIDIIKSYVTGEGEGKKVVKACMPSSV